MPFEFLLVATLVDGAWRWPSPTPICYDSGRMLTSTGQNRVPAMLLCVLCLVGCRSKPFSEDALAFVRVGETTRQEVVENFGEPGYKSPDASLAAYVRETIRGTESGWVWTREQSLPLVTMDTQQVGRRRHALCFAFDSAQRVKRFEVISFEPDVEIATALGEWGFRGGNQ